MTLGCIGSRVFLCLRRGLRCVLPFPLFRPSSLYKPGILVLATIVLLRIALRLEVWLERVELECVFRVNMDLCLAAAF